MVNAVHLYNSTLSSTKTTEKTSSNGFANTLDSVTKSNNIEKTSLDNIFQKASEKYNIPVNFLKSVAKAESNFNPKAVSKSGARGVMQLMPETAKYLGVKDSFDPEQNIMGGAKYLSQLYEKYDGNTKLTLAAYNAGMGNVSKYNGIPPFKETQNYVVKVMNYMGQDIKTPDTVVSTQVQSPSSSANTINYGTYTPIESTVSNEDSDSVYSYEDYLKLVEEFKQQMNWLFITSNYSGINSLNSNSGFDF